ncbi:MAG: hypothetical protein Q4D61_05530 [Cardiobacteriaceae bacterium]|nr:hypothetical protein [Cardiobacteriaceae bacterium]
MENLKNLLSILAKTIALTTPIGIILGGMSIYFYLKLIESSNFFMDFSQQPFVLLLPSIICLIFFLLIYGFLLFPLWTANIIIEKNLYLKPLESNNKKNYWQYILFAIIFSPIILTIIYLLSSIFIKSEYSRGFLEIFLISIFAIIYIVFIGNFIKKIHNHKKYKKHKDWKTPFTWTNFIDILFMLTLNSIITTLFCISSFLLVLNNGKGNEIYQTLIISILIFIITINHIFIYLRFFKRRSMKTKNILLSPFMLTITYLLITLQSTSFFTTTPLKFFGTIDLTSRWYIIDPNIQINFEDKKDPSKYSIIKIKQQFKCSNKKCSTTQNANQYALYGYMAWNAGDTKIFCPPTAQFGLDKKKNLESAEMCLFIESKFIKPLREMYSDFDDVPHSGSNTSWL